MFGKENKKSKWKIDYEDTIYKVYDWNGNVAAYFFPNYELQEDTENADENIEELNRRHQNVRGGNILFPMAKLNVLDKEEAIDLDYTILALEQSLQRVKIWKEWISKNYMKFMITGNGVHTSREDREMLSIALGLELNIILGEKEVLVALTPLLDELNNAGLL
ncbi:MAG TPA: hypothetical protein VJ599_05925 [Nitrososphaeraceae archaeon]|nr:hypothetical protein [Nitrososphaeraceae archaeon]